MFVAVATARTSTEIVGVPQTLRPVYMRLSRIIAGELPGVEKKLERRYLA